MKLKKQLNKALQNIEAEYRWVINYKVEEKENTAYVFAKTPNEAISKLKLKSGIDCMEILSCLAI